VTLGLASRRPVSNALGLLVLTFLYGCQVGEQGESQSDEPTAQDQTFEDTRQTQGGDSNGVQGELGSQVAEIMNSSRYQERRVGIP
jgi:hypothetical protein